MTEGGVSRMPRVVPPFYFLGGLVLMVALHQLAPARTLLAWPASLAGLIPVALGFVLSGQAAARFRRVGTPIRPGSEATALVRDGPFRFTRNPMYLGMTLILLGIALLLGSLSPLLVPPLFMALITALFIRREERWMEETFGESYRSYRRRVRRWL